MPFCARAAAGDETEAGGASQRARSRQGLRACLSLLPPFFGVCSFLPSRIVPARPRDYSLGATAGF